jgi:hypothetical protein
MDNKETLEEAAEKYVEDFDLSFYDTVEEIPVKEIGKKDFINGAKWQQNKNRQNLLMMDEIGQFQFSKPKMYSEEEVLNFTQTMLMQYKFGNTNIEQMDLLKETFQLFKNK